jgi:hypothetical protein
VQAVHERGVAGGSGAAWMRAESLISGAAAAAWS